MQYAQLWGLQRTLGDTTVQLFSPVPPSPPPPLDGVEFSVLCVREREAPPALGLPPPLRPPPLLFSFVAPDISPHFRSTPATAPSHTSSLFPSSFSHSLSPLSSNPIFPCFYLHPPPPQKNHVCQHHNQSRTGYTFFNFDARFCSKSSCGSAVFMP